MNFVWNFDNELSFKHTQRTGQFMSAYDLYGRGRQARPDPAFADDPGDQRVIRRPPQAVQESQAALRVSNGSSRSLGWIQVKAAALRYKNGQVHYQGQPIGLWDSYGLSGYTLGQGSFSEDARGRWHLNVSVKIEAAPHLGTASVGIDLGLKACAATSDGDKLIGRNYRKHEKALGIAQRAGKKDRARAIHAKIKNCRNGSLHKFSTKLAAPNAAIFVGNVSSAKLVKTRMAKSTLDAGWGMLKTMLEYKSRWACIVFDVVDEAYSTQTCSRCRSIPASSPKGGSGLGMREWICSDCGAHHDRDVNTAANILAAGMAVSREDVKL